MLASGRRARVSLHVWSSRSGMRQLLAGAGYLLGLKGHRRCGWSLTGVSRFRVVAEGLLSGTVVLPALLRVLVPAAAIPGSGSVSQLSAVPLDAVAVPAIVRDTDLERLAALEAHNLVEVDRIRAPHAPARRTSTIDAASGTL
jgi:hypothetical protein